MKSKFVSLFALSAAMLLAGCGEDRNTTAAPAKDSTPTAEPAKDTTTAAPAKDTTVATTAQAPAAEKYDVVIAGKTGVVLTDLFASTTVTGSKTATGTSFEEGETVSLVLVAKTGVTVEIKSVKAAQTDEAKTVVALTAGADEFHYSFTMPKGAVNITIEARVKPDLALDLSKTVASTDGKTYSDGVFTLGEGDTLNVSGGETTALKIGGNSQVKAGSVKHAIKFTTAKAGKIHVEIKGGTSGEATRVGYVAEAATDGSVARYLTMEQLTLKEDGSCEWVDMDTVLPEAGTYYILSNAATQVRNIEVTYDEALGEKDVEVIDETQASANEFNAQYLLPGVYAEDHKVGNFTFKAGAEVTYYGKVTTNSVNRYSVVLLQEGESFTFDSKSVGTLTLETMGTAAKLANGTYPMSTLTAVDTNGNAVTVTNGAAIKNKDDGKKGTVVSALLSEGVYTFTVADDGDDTTQKAVAIYLGSYQAI